MLRILRPCSNVPCADWKSTPSLCFRIEPHLSDMHSLLPQIHPILTLLFRLLRLLRPTLQTHFSLRRIKLLPRILPQKTHQLHRTLSKRRNHKPQPHSKTPSQQYQSSRDQRTLIFRSLLNNSCTFPNMASFPRIANLKSSTFTFWRPERLATWFALWHVSITKSVASSSRMRTVSSRGSLASPKA